VRVLKPCQVIHGDVNDQNVLMDDTGMEVAGFIDLGDMCETWRVNEVAIAMAYAMLGKEEPIEAATHMLVGYTSVVSLTAVELQVLPTLVACRVACSVVLGAYSHSLDPENDYLLVTQVG
jgi:Ser/Thr protein kinase RdoA (MazF antagonist)